MKNALLAMVLMTAAASAQWLNYPSTGVPKTPTGIPNLGAPTPRLADGKPDLSGIWEPNNDIPCPKEGCQDGQIGNQFRDIAYGMKEGLPYQPWAAELVKERKAGLGKDDPTSGRCLPPGAMRQHTIPTYKKYVHVPGLLILLSEHNVNYRQIYTDGRPLLKDPQPTWNGYSTAKWDGDVLVVESNGFRDNTWIDGAGNPLTESARITERFHRVNYGNMEIDITIDDPKAYTKPWTVHLKQFIVLNTEMLDYFCLDNEKDAKHLVGK